MDYIGTTINQSPTIVLKASADLTAVQGIAFGVSSGKAALPSAGANAIGVAIISQDANIKSGEDIVLQIKDVGKMVASAAIAVGAEVSVTNAGKAKTAESGEFILGTALTAATAAGDLISVQITKSGYKPASA